MVASGAEGEMAEGARARGEHGDEARGGEEGEREEGEGVVGAMVAMVRANRIVEARARVTPRTTDENDARATTGEEEERDWRAVMEVGGEMNEQDGRREAMARWKAEVGQWAE